MKSKTFMKTIVLVMIFVMMLQLALPASAAYSWTSSGYQYSGTVITGGDINRFSMHNTANYVDHVGGKTSTITATVQSSHRKTADTSLSSNYGGKVGNILSSYNYADTVTRTIYNGERVTVPATATSGRYIMAIRFPGSRITVVVKKYAFDSDGNAYLVETDSKTSSYTPRIGAAVLTYYAH